MKIDNITELSREERFKVKSGKHLAKIVSNMIDFDKLFEKNETERFIFAGININLRLVCIGNIIFGKMNIQDPHDVFYDAVLRKAKYGMIVQYVKDREIEPTDKDIENTIELMTSNSAITVLDHIIILGNRYYSFLEKGIFEELEDIIEESKSDIKTKALKKCSEIMAKNRLKNNKKLF